MYWSGHPEIIILRSKDAQVVLGVAHVHVVVLQKESYISKKIIDEKCFQKVSFNFEVSFTDPSYLFVCQGL